MFNEECWIIYGKKVGKRYVGFRVYEGKGSPASVGFDWDKALKRAGGIIGFHHTHPDGFCRPSDRDHKTMRAWVVTEGRPLLCSITSGEKTGCWIYARNKDRKIECQPVKMKTCGSMVIAKPYKEYV